jgi:hypothetical protein
MTVIVSTCETKPGFLLLSIADLLTRGVLSDERTGLYFQLLLIFTSAVILVKKNREFMSIFYSLTFSNLVGQTPVYISPRNRVAQFFHKTFFLSPHTSRRDMWEVDTPGM